MAGITEEKVVTEINVTIDDNGDITIRVLGEVAVSELDEEKRRDISLELIGVVARSISEYLKT